MDYFQLFSYEHLYKSFLKARKNKRHKKEVIMFEINISYNLNSLKEELDSFSYKIQKYNTFYVYEPKKRKVDAISFKDRIVQHCLVDYYLMPLLERILIYDNGACRKNKGTDFARKRLRLFISSFIHKYGYDTCYFLKIDFHHYFESINHLKLITILNRYIKDTNIMDLCINIITSYNKKEGNGLPLGNQTSQCFALLYLNRFDRIIKEKYHLKYYVRYMDDCVFLSNNKNILINLLNDLRMYISSLDLSFNDNKTGIFQFNKVPISFLGFNYSLNKQRKIKIQVINQKHRRFLKHLNKIDNLIEKKYLKEQYDRYLKMREK